MILCSVMYFIQFHWLQRLRHRERRRVFWRHVAARGLSGDENGILGDAALYVFCQKAGLDLQHSAV